MSASLLLPATVLGVVLLLMLAELVVSRSNERAFRARGAVVVPDGVYRAMQVAYPGSFVAMAIEGAVTGRAVDRLFVAGAAILLLGKGLKTWAIVSLGDRWTYRVLVRPGEPLVTAGPYRYFRHPNYVGVIGELVGMAVMMAAPVSGILGTAFFAELLRRRMAAEERALGLRVEPVR